MQSFPHEILTQMKDKTNPCLEPCQVILIGQRRVWAIRIAVPVEHLASEHQPIKREEDGFQRKKKGDISKG